MLTGESEPFMRVLSRPLDGAFMEELRQRWGYSRNRSGLRNGRKLTRIDILWHNTYCFRTNYGCINMILCTCESSSAHECKTRICLQVTLHRPASDDILLQIQQHRGNINISAMRVCSQSNQCPLSDDFSRWRDFFLRGPRQDTIDSIRRAKVWIFLWML
jgi:hypothetical protein